MGTPRHEDLAEAGPVPTDIRQVGPDWDMTERGMRRRLLVRTSIVISKLA